MNRMLVTGFVVLATLAWDTVASAQSLYQRGRKNHVALISDNRAHRVGDILTILVSEYSKVEDDAEAKFDKSSSAKAEITSFEPYPDIAKDVLPMEWSSSRTFDGKAEVDREGKFDTRITATVIDVQPNGNLVVEGKRRVVLDGEERFMTITGIVRPLDVSAANSIASELVANGTVTYEACGPLSRSTKKNWFERVVDILWPF